jgi:hypothetical protein
MTKLLPILFLIVAGVAQAAERITATITVTNTPGTTNSITINSTFRYWTNASTLGTILTNLTGKNAATTNLYNQIASYPYSGGVILRWADTNQIQLIGNVGGALAGSIGGTWATLTLATQSGPQTYTALWPLENMVGATNRTNQASSFVKGLSDYSTNAFATNATATSNYITKGASPAQTIASPLNMGGATRVFSGLYATNGFTSGMTNINPVSSNQINYGNAIRSEGSGGNSLQVGSNAISAGDLSMAIGNGAVASNTTSLAVGIAAKATNNYSMAVGNNAIAGGVDTLAVGRGSQAYESGAMSIGQASIAQGTGAVALQSEVVGNSSIGIGTSSSVTATNSTAIGPGATSIYNDSSAFGKNATTTTTNEIVLGTSADAVHVPGRIEGAVSTNGTFRGTNILNGRLDVTPRANTALANGYNSAVVFGTNLWVEFSGPSAAYTNAGFAAPGGPQLVWGQFDNPGLSFTILNESGIEATAANRITTETGGLLNSTNRTVFVGFKYDTTTSRWRVISFR